MSVIFFLMLVVCAGIFVLWLINEISFKRQAQREGKPYPGLWSEFWRALFK